MVTVLTTPNELILLPEGGAPRTESIPGLRYALVADLDGDTLMDLAIFTETHVWIGRYAATGSIASGKVALASVPENLSISPLKSEGRSVLMSVGAEKVSFYVLHPAKGLVEVGSVPAPALA